MLPTLKVIVPALAIVLVVGVLLGATGAPLSLATDLGYSEADVCRALDEHGAQAVARLDASGFPHASTSRVEVYRLQREGVTEASVRIDWAGGTAGCTTAGAAPTATVVMTDRAYEALVVQLTNVIATGDLDAGGVGHWWNLWWGTDVEIHGNAAYNAKYERTVAAWGAGWLAQEAL